MRSLRRGLDYFFLLRPVLLIPVWSVFLAGYVASVRTIRFNEWFEFPGSLRLWLTLISLTLVVGGIFLLEQIDELKNEANRLNALSLSEGYVSVKNARRLSAISIAFGIALGFLISLVIAVTYLTLTILWGYLYNYSPFKWKDRPVLGLATNMLAVLLCFATGWNLVAEFNMDFLYQAMPYLLVIGGVVLLSTVSEHISEISRDRRTFPSEYGVAYTTWLAAGFVIFAFLGGFYLRDILIIVSTAISMPFFVQAAVTETKASSLRAARYSVLFFSLIVCAKLPFYFVVVLLTYTLSKYYYRDRFGLDYPTLRIDS